MEEHAPNDTGAGAGNRTPIPSLENLYTNRCTTPAGNIASIPYLCTAHTSACPPTVLHPSSLSHAHIFIPLIFVTFLSFHKTMLLFEAIAWV